LRGRSQRINRDIGEIREERRERGQKIWKEEKGREEKRTLRGKDHIFLHPLFLSLLFPSNPS
jgi:hypothetical protein